MLTISALVLSAVSIWSTERYTTRYQSLPVLDWVESRQPLVESTDVPPASDLARGLSRVVPLLAIRGERSILVTFGPPGYIQRTMGGVRDAARIELRSPGLATAADAPVAVNLDVIVFNRAVRAAAWSELMSFEMDIKDPESGAAQVRTSGPDETDGVWLNTLSPEGGVANVVGHRGVVGFVVRVILARQGPADAAELADLSARAEQLARQAAADWTATL